MTIADQIHKSRTHREGFDPSCPKCVKDGGIPAIIKHLKACAHQNELDFAAGDEGALSTANEQRRMIGVLGLYRKEWL